MRFSIQVHFPLKPSWRPILASCLALCFASPCLSQEATGIEAALPAIRKLNDPNALVGALSGAAMQRMQMDDFDKAIAYVDEALDIARKSDDPSQIETPLFIAGQVLNRLSPDAATSFMASVLSESSNKPEVEKRVLKLLGEHLQRSGDTVGAIQVLHDFAEVCKKTDPNSEEAAWAMLQYGQACVNGRMFDLGQPALEEAKTLAKKLGKLNIVQICESHLANACLGTEQFDVAADLFVQQLEAAKAGRDKDGAASAIAGLVTALLGMKEYEQAGTVLENNIPEVGGLQKGELLALQATLRSVQDDLKAALASSKSAVEARLSALPEISKKLVGPTTVMHDKLTQAYLHLRLGEFEGSLAAAEAAEQGYKDLVKQLQRAAKFGAVNLDSSLAGFSDLLSAISDIRQQVAVANNEPEQALLAAESGRGQAQVLSMRRNFKLSDDQAESESLTLEQIRELSKSTGTTFVEYSVVQQYDYLTRGRVSSGESEFQANRIFIWVVTPEGKIRFAKQEFPHSVSKFVEALRDEIAPEKRSPPLAAESSPAPDAEQDAAIVPEKTQDERSIAKQRLAYDLLWKPIKDYLPKDPSKTIAVIPHGSLFAVPFAALLDPESQPIIASHTITTAASIELFGLAAQRQSASSELDFKDVLIVGNPKMPLYKVRPDQPASPLDPLPGSEAEAKAIAGMFGLEPLIGAQASETAVKRRMASAPVIHLATHGLLETDTVFTRSYLSAVALADDADSDGFLTVREVMEMELKAELAVLSACDSGRGKITGDGVIGLSRGYLSAGVPSVVVSLWPVSDQATAYMMVQFYGALGKGLGKAAALRSAILSTREQAPDPRLWAPFTLYGFGN